MSHTWSVRLFFRIWLNAVINFGCLLSMGCQDKQEISVGSDLLEKIPDQEGFDSVLSFTSKGVLEYEVYYSRMLRYANKKEIHFLDGVVLYLYEKGRFQSEIKAASGVLDERRDEMSFSGNVHVFSVNGMKLNTEKLLWKSALDTVTSDTFVTIITVAQDTIHGVGFGSGSAFQNWLIEKPNGVTQKRIKLEMSNSRKEK